jgi:hypothetical protein
VDVFIAIAGPFAQAGRADWNGKSGRFPVVQEAFKMKMLIFLIIFALVAFVVFWRVRKADAEKDLERRKAMKSKQEKRKEVITSDKHVKWPVIIRPGGKESVEAEEEAPEPTMTSIEFEPVDHTSLRQ